MNMISNMEVQDFVNARFGEALAAKLGNIGRGAGNNKKGADFEGYYATHTIVLIGASLAPAECALHHVSCQEAAFVDDLCVRDHGTGRKTNYQAKNSDGSAADWTVDMQARFEMQGIIDTDHHGAAEHEQVLVVSCETKAEANKEKIPKSMRGYCRSEHFPYEQSSIELLMTHQPLREAMSRLCASCSLARLDEAFRIILGQWHADNCTGRTVLDVLTKAKASARPDIFGGFTPLALATETGQRSRPDTPPQWLVDLLNRFQMGTVG